MNDKKLSILIVDDEPLHVQIVKDFCLEAAPSTLLILTAIDGAEALKILEERNGQLDILITDINMPNVSGLELLKICDERKYTFATIALTGYADRAVVLEAMRLRVFDVIDKPLDRELFKFRFNKTMNFVLDRDSKAETIQSTIATLTAAFENEKVELEAMNGAMSRVLSQLEKEKAALNERVALNIEKNIYPLLTALEEDPQTNKQLTDQLRKNLGALSDAFYQKLIRYKIGLSPAELKICNLVKEGDSAKEIAQKLSVSVTTINEHKWNIRKKLGLNKRSINLKIYLSELSAKQ